MGKNIVVFSDGTGQKGGEGVSTNVYQLFTFVEDRTPRQIAFYDPGLGTDWKKITGNAFGLGFSRNLKQCYQFIFDNFESGDQIYLFGFSRGAATVRSLASFINRFGILPKSRPDLIKEAYRLYKNRATNHGEMKIEAFREKHNSMKSKIAFLGVWDTVAALGFPHKGPDVLLDRLFKHDFHNFDLSENVEFARQALAIDDERKTFHPILWSKINNDTQKRIKQVWFAGVHTDIGGGYPEQGLSDISLNWMIDEATEKGLIIYNKSDKYAKFIGEKTDNSNDMMHDEQTGWLGKIYRRARREWKQNGVKREEKPLIHESVLSRTKNQHNKDTPPYTPWIIEGLSENKYETEKWNISKPISEI